MPASAERPELVDAVSRQIRRDFGALAAPFTIHRPVPDLYAAVWAVHRECVLTGRVRREVKEAVAAAVSARNQCPYCVDAHTVMLDGLGAHGAAAALSRAATPDDPEVAAGVEWALAIRAPGAAVLRTPPFPPDHLTELAGTAVQFHFVNRMVSVLLGPTPLPIRAGAPKTVARRLAGVWFSRAIRREKERGASLQFVQDGPLPPELGWVASDPVVAHAFAALHAAAEDAGAALDVDVRRGVLDAVAAWDGADPGPTRAWATDYVPDAQLLVLTAIAPYQVDNDLVTGFRERHGSEAALVGALAWASWRASLRVASWLG